MAEPAPEAGQQVHEPFVVCSYGPPMTLHELADAHGAGVGASKPHRYYEIYEELLERLRDQPLHLLELGVESGRSISTWCDYLPNATVVGLDIHERPDDYPARAHYVQGRQEDTSVLARACKIASPFDVIIDDAAHVGRLAKASFAFLFERHLKPGGCYVLEDFGTSLTKPNWPDAHAYKSRSMTTIGCRASSTA